MWNYVIVRTIFYAIKIRLGGYIDNLCYLVEIHIVLIENTNFFYMIKMASVNDKDIHGIAWLEFFLKAFAS